MTQDRLDHEVAAATGESIQTISSLGFVPLTRIPYERDREPLVVDWDDLELEREALYPVAC